ncbi:MAG: HAD hydrolase family protein [Candidatus Cloacimonetes bacterium]|nr:HAD hydrolase family protein [Candidatus Cloacimonadota bacterium]
MPLGKETASMSPGAAGPVADPCGLRLLALDCDGVLTPGHIIYDNRRIESKQFSARDGMGLRLLSFVGIEVAVVTGRSSELLAQRCADLSIGMVMQGVANKRAAIETIHGKLGITWRQTAVMGDDWNDWPMLERAGLCAAPADAAVGIRRRVHLVTPSGGGQGAIRELVDHILRQRNQYAHAIQSLLDYLAAR